MKTKTFFFNFIFKFNLVNEIKVEPTIKGYIYFTNKYNEKSWQKIGLMKNFSFWEALYRFCFQHKHMNRQFLAESFLQTIQLGYIGVWINRYAQSCVFQIHSFYFNIMENIMNYVNCFHLNILNSI